MSEINKSLTKLLFFIFIAFVSSLGSCTPKDELGGLQQATVSEVAQKPASLPITKDVRTTVVISDLHMGPGRVKDQGRSGDWNPMEDFRWPRAFKGFLDWIAANEKGSTDLVIAGDFLDLWQPPYSLVCRGYNKDYGCSLEEMRMITARVLSAHEAELKALREFASEKGHCVYFIPGNHDAAFVSDHVWGMVEQKLTTDATCVELIRDGIWTSADRRIWIEHGHQIGLNANGYGKDWPNIINKFGTCNDPTACEYLMRPWGEAFMVFLNEAEQEFQLIDNISPELAGAKYHMADHGWELSTQDVARFLKFNLVDISLSQFVQVAGSAGGEPDKPPTWDLEVARSLGHKLFLGAMDPNDPFAKNLKEKGGKWAEVRSELDALARNEEFITENELRSLCDQLAIRKSVEQCKVATAGALMEALLKSRQRIITPHVEMRREQNPALEVFVYGHTHAFESPWTVSPGGYGKIIVANSGAFQRLIDDKRLRKLATERGVKPAQMFKDLSLKELDPCYTAVFIRPQGDELDVKLLAWRMAEDGEGRLVYPCEECPDVAGVGHGCENKEESKESEGVVQNYTGWTTSR